MFCLFECIHRKPVQSNRNQTGRVCSRQLAIWPWTNIIPTVGPSAQNTNVDFHYFVGAREYEQTQHIFRLPGAVVS